MISIVEAAGVALATIKSFDTCTEYENYFVFGSVENPKDGGGVIAVHKATGEPMTFVAVLGELGKEIRTINYPS